MEFLFTSGGEIGVKNYPLQPCFLHSSGYFLNKSSSASLLLALCKLGAEIEGRNKTNGGDWWEIRLPMNHKLLFFLFDINGGNYYLTHTWAYSTLRLSKMLFCTPRFVVGYILR